MRKYIIILITFISILGCQEEVQLKKKNIERIKNETIVLKEENVKNKSTTKEMSNKAFFELIHYYQDNYEQISKEEFISDLLPDFKKLKAILCTHFDEGLFNEYAKMILSVDKKLNKTDIEKIFIEIFNCQKGKTTDLLHQQQKDSFFLKILNKRYLNDKI